MSLAMPTPAISTGVSVNFLALSRGQSTRAAAPSDRGAQSSMPSGSATQGAPSTAFSGSSRRYWALGFMAPLRWFFTATAAICSRVVP